MAVNADERDEIAASIAAHAELGSRYDSAVAEGLVERIGEEIDKRVEARLSGLGQQPVPGQPHLSPGQRIVPPGYGGQQQAQAAAPASRRSGVVAFWGTVLGLGSMGIGIGTTAVVVSHHGNAAAQVVMVVLIWAAITLVNIAQARRH